MLTKGNKKLDKSVGIFSLPAIITCPNCRECAASCYAKVEQDRFPVTYQHRMRNYTLSQTEDFHRLMVNEIISKKVKVVRIHESGDFYSAEYVRKWIAIAKSLPTVRFYGYSKCFDRYKYGLPELNKLPNVNIINSITPIGKNYGQPNHIEKLVNLGYMVCPMQAEQAPPGMKCMRDCNLCLTSDKVCFVAHGARRKRA